MFDYRGKGQMAVEAELRSPIAISQITHIFSPEPAEGEISTDAFRLDLSLSPRPNDASASYRNRWAPARFEKLGQLFAMPPSTAICARGSASDFSALVLQLPTAAVSEWFDGEIDWSDRKLSACFDLKHGAIRSLLSRLADETRRPGFASQVLVECIAAQAAVELARHCKVIGDLAEAGGLAAWRLRLIDERLEELGAPPTLAELSGLCRLSSRQIARAFRISRGCSISEYILAKRVETAKRLLATDRNVKTIAFEMGFRSPSSFSFAFRRSTGLTPVDYRQTLLGCRRTFVRSATQVTKTRLVQLAK